MVTYSDLIQTGILIIGLIDLEHLTKPKSDQSGSKG